MGIEIVNIRAEKKRIVFVVVGCCGIGEDTGMSKGRDGIGITETIRAIAVGYELVKEMVSQSEVYVFEADEMIQGFVGLNAEYIEGIFVSDEMQSCGIGKLLLDYVKDKKVSLRLNVYQKNARAISFYQREGFIIQCEDLDEDTGEKEYTMLWKRK